MLAMQLFAQELTKRIVHLTLSFVAEIRNRQLLTCQVFIFFDLTFSYFIFCLLNDYMYAYVINTVCWRVNAIVLGFSFYSVCIRISSHSQSHSQ